MIKEITYDEIPRTIYQRGFKLSFPPGISEDLYFLVDEDVTAILKQYETVWDYLIKSRPYPKGINMIKAIDKDGKYVIVDYDKKLISKEDAAGVLRSLFANIQ